MRQLKQKINLYQSFATPSQEQIFLTWNKFLQLNALALIFLLLSLFYDIWSVHRLENTKENLSQKTLVKEAAFKKVKASYPQLIFSDDATKSVSELKKQVDVQAKVLNSIANQLPFSARLIALARVTTPNVWLTDIIFAESELLLTLKGKSLSMESLQAFLNSLQHDKTFAGFVLNINNIENNTTTTTPQPLTFEVTMAKKTT